MTEANETKAASDKSISRINWDQFTLDKHIYLGLIKWKDDKPYIGNRLALPGEVQEV